MTRRILITLVVLSTIAGCARVSDSRLNPFNWFGRSERVAVVQGANIPQLNLVSQIIELKAEQVPGGAIIRATGLPPRQGYYDGELVLVGAEDGVLGYQFALSAPLGETSVSTQRSREIVVALFVSSQKLAGVRQIKVSAAGNALAIRR